MNKSQYTKWYRKINPLGDDISNFTRMCYFSVGLFLTASIDFASGVLSIMSDTVFIAAALLYIMPVLLKGMDSKD